MRLRTCTAAFLVLALVAACGESGIDESDGPDAGGQEATTTIVPATGAAETSTTTQSAADPTEETTLTTSIPDDDDRPADTTQPPPPTTEGDNGSAVDPALGSIVDAAISDLAARLGVDPGDVEVVLAETVVWPDASLGCPTPGMSYAQVTTDGARILLAVGGTQYHYHTGGTRSEPFLCETPADA